LNRRRIVALESLSMSRSASDEERRLSALRDLEVLDTPSERTFERLTETAALVCGVPISLLSLIDADRQWFKANVGLPGTTQTPREHAFCSVAIRGDDILEIPDARLDPRFADNPMVVGDPGIRFYAGAPLCLDDGLRIGTLCIIDRVPRQLDATQREVLGNLACVALKLLEARRTSLDLERSEARFRALSESSPLGVFATDENGACTYANARWQRILGQHPQRTRGQHWTRVCHPEERSTISLRWQQAAAAGREFDREFRILRADGTARHVRVLTRPVLAEGTEPTTHVGSVDDITERKTRELALRRSESLLSETGILADVGGWELDLVSGVLSWSDQTCRIHGLEPGYRPQLDEAVNFYAPDARPRIREAVERAIVGGHSWDLELPFVRADRQRIWVRTIGRAEIENGEPIRLLGAFQDITSRVLQRRALNSAHERLVMATESGRIGVWEWNITHDKLDWTPRMYELFGLTAGPDPLTVERWFHSVHSEDRERLERAVREAAAEQGELDAEFRIVHDDGRTCHLCVAGRTMRGANDGRWRMLGASWDVTPLRSLSDALTEQHALLHMTLQSIGDAVITTDAAGRVAWLNPVAERLTGWTSAQAKERPLAQVFRIAHENARQGAIDPSTLGLRQGSKLLPGNRTMLTSRSGDVCAIEDSAAPIKDATGKNLGTVLVFHDASEQRRLSDEMTYRATHDSLTGLVNRAELEICLQGALSRSHAQEREHALLYIDLDRFKLVNDACGHAAGDRLLKRVASLMGSVIRTHDTLARTGGDEFAAILEDCPHEQARQVAQGICDRLDDFRFVHDGQRFRIGASVGLVTIDRRWSSIEAVMQAADVSCYAAKEAGRNRVHAWRDTDGNLRERDRETRWVTCLEQALDENRFVLFAQRIDTVSAQADGVHAEVLVRLRDDQGRLVGPGVFLPAAERFHLATRIDGWVLGRVIEQLERLPDLRPVKTLCVNISGQSIGDRAFHREAIDTLTRAGSDICTRLCLEITETAAITNMADAVAFAERVRDLGADIALDDFGAGASSFGYLRTLPVDVLKIDGRYIQNMIHDPLDEVAVRCFVDVARLTGVRTVAEYVDRTEVLERVRAIGIDQVQGFLIHEPEPIENVLPPHPDGIRGTGRKPGTSAGTAP